MIDNLFSEIGCSPYVGRNQTVGLAAFCDVAEEVPNTLRDAARNSQLKKSIAVINAANNDKNPRMLPMRYPHQVKSLYPIAGDQKLVQIVDSALADAARRSGAWLACRPGCTQCCIGVFAINQLDAARLERGLNELQLRDPRRANAVRKRARESVRRLSADFPGDPATGILHETKDAQSRFEDFANDEPCPVLDPQTGLCELYDSRPMTCRVFGPPVRSEDGLGVCELCFQGATDEQIAACEMKPDPTGLETRLIEKLEKSTGAKGNTIIAFCLGS